MISGKAFLLLVSFVPALAIPDEYQVRFGDQRPLARVAIIGAGISGTSTAFHLHELYQTIGPLSITIFEKNSYIGGRVASVSPPPETNLRILEAGAIQFSTDDRCLMDAVRHTGLETTEPSYLYHPRTFGVWNGHELTEGTCDLKSRSWRELARLVWKYGLSPWRLHQDLLKSAEKWYYFATYLYISNNVLKQMERIGLGASLRLAGSYLDNINVTSAFQRNFVQPCTRALFSQDLNNVSGIAALFALWNSKPVTVEGGNSRLINRMILLSRADLHLNSKVLDISQGLDRRYRLTIESNDSATPDTAEFDVVIIAAPLKGNQEEIGMSFGLFDSVQTHVTHFTTPRPLSPKYFRLPSNITLPDNILTTHGDLFSVSTSQIVYFRDCSPGEECDDWDQEYLYRVHSRNLINDEDIWAMIDQKPPADNEPKKEIPEVWFPNDSEPLIDGITWIHRQEWPQAFPRYYGNSTIPNQIEMEPGLFHTGAAEAIVSSMEMACRMGYEVAYTLYNRDR